MYFPIFIDLSDKKILVVGAGAVALRRIRTLCGFAGEIHVCAPKVRDEIWELSEKFPIVIEEQAFTPAQLDGQDFVLAATDNAALNREIAGLCKEKGIPVNVCSEKELCDFYFPSVLKKDEIVIGINASGKDHGLVKRTRIELEEFLKGRLL